MKLIDKDALVSILEAKADMACGEPKLYFMHIAGMVNLLPEVDAVEVVRCKDCVYCEKSYRGLHCDIVGDNLLPDFYCACGERKEDK